MQVKEIHSLIMSDDLPKAPLTEPVEESVLPGETHAAADILTQADGEPGESPVSQAELHAVASAPLASPVPGAVGTPLENNSSQSGIAPVELEVGETVSVTLAPPITSAVPAPQSKEEPAPNYVKVYKYQSEITPAELQRARLAQAAQRKKAGAETSTVNEANALPQQKSAMTIEEHNAMYLKAVAESAEDRKKRTGGNVKRATKQSSEGIGIATRNMLIMGQEEEQRRALFDEMEKERTQWRASHPHNDSTTYKSFDTEGMRVNRDGEVEVEFLRGINADVESRNNRNNRMESGSYSRYMLNLDPIMPSVEDVVDSFDGYASIVGTHPRDPQQAMREDIRQKVAQDERKDRDARYLRRTTYFNGTSTQSDLHHYYHFADETDTPTEANKSHSFSHTIGGIPHNGLCGSVRSWGNSTGMTREYYRSIYRKDLAGTRNYNNAIRREVELLDEDTHDELLAERARRRCDPHHGKSDIQNTGGDFVYYNSKSKGFFVPRDPPLDALMLNYNHLYDFGNGTRFDTSSYKYLDKTVGENVVIARRNPIAQGPVPYPDSRGASWKAVRGGLARPGGGRGVGSHGKLFQRSGGDPGEASNFTGQAALALRVNPRSLKREDIDKMGGHSLATARALNVDKDIRQTQCKNTPSIEDILFRHSDFYLTHGRTTDSVSAVVEKGKVDRNEVPQDLMRTIEEQREFNETIRSGPAGSKKGSRSEGRTRLNQRISGADFNQSLSRTGGIPHTDHPSRGLLGVMAGVPQSFASSDGGVKKSRASLSGDQPSSAAHSHSLQNPKRAYEVSRLKYVKNYNTTM